MQFVLYININLCNLCCIFFKLSVSLLSSKLLDRELWITKSKKIVSLDVRESIRNGGCLGVNLVFMYYCATTICFFVK